MPVPGDDEPTLSASEHDDVIPELLDVPVDEPTVQTATVEAPVASGAEPAVPASPVPTPRGIVVTPEALTGVVVAVLIAVGSLGTWADAGFISVSGLHGTDGVVTLIAGIIALLAVVVGRWPGIPLVAGLVAAAVGIVDLSQVLGIDTELFSISPGWGLVMVVVGGVGTVAWSLFTISRLSDKRWLIVAASLSTAVLAVVIALGAAGVFTEDGGSPPDDVAAAQSDASTSSDTDSASTQDDAASDAAPSSPTTAVKMASPSNQVRLTGSDGVEVVATVEGIIDPLWAGDYDEPSSGDRYVGVKVRLTNTGTAAYDDSPGNGATLTYGADQQADSTLVSGGACSGGFSSSTKIAPGGQRRGCIVFEVPERNTVKSFQLSLDSGFAGETGQWNVRQGKPKSQAPAKPVADAGEDQTSSSAPDDYTACDQNISAGPGTTCQFANAVFKRYAAHLKSGGGADVSLSAYSSAVGASISMSCIDSEGVVDCGGGSGADVIFPKWAADVY